MGPGPGVKTPQPEPKIFIGLLEPLPVVDAVVGMRLSDDYVVDVWTLQRCCDGLLYGADARHSVPGAHEDGSAIALALLLGRLPLRRSRPGLCADVASRRTAGAWPSLVRNCASRPDTAVNNPWITELRAAGVPGRQGPLSVGELGVFAADADGIGLGHAGATGLPVGNQLLLL